MLYFEDIAAGQTYRSPRLRIDAAAITAFAAEFDPQPFHLDDAAARASLF
ncbi:MAG: dehydratase, partial [Alphaproteobacteria bacterium]